MVTLALTESAVVFSDTTCPLFCPPDEVNGVISNGSRVKTYPKLPVFPGIPQSTRRLLFNHTSSRRAVRRWVVVYQSIDLRPGKRENVEYIRLALSRGSKGDSSVVPPPTANVPLWLGHSSPPIGGGGGEGKGGGACTSWVGTSPPLWYLS